MAATATPERQRPEAAEERVVTVRPRTVLSVALELLALALVLWVVYAARHVLVWVVVAAFLALAMNPAIVRVQRVIPRRGAAAAIIYVTTLGALVGLGYLLIGPLVDQVRGLMDAVPGYVRDLTHGRGPLGFLERDYHVVERVRDALHGSGGESALNKAAGGVTTALSVAKGIVNTIVACVTIAFLTFFMVVDGPALYERMLSFAPAAQRPRWRHVGERVAGTVSGYVTGNLFISVIAGGSTAIVLTLCNVPFALALGLLVAILDLIPLAGATLAGIVVVTIALLTSTGAGIIVGAYFIVYQQIENHLLQPLVYGRTVEVSALGALIAVLVGAAVAGVIGALLAIPVAGTIGILVNEWLQYRRS